MIDVGGATGGNRTGRMGITGRAGKVGVSGGNSAGGIAEPGGRTGANPPILTGGTDASSPGARVSTNCI